MSQKVKETIEMIVKDNIESQINYEWGGSDFHSRLMDNLPMDEMDFKTITEKSSGDVTFDNDLYEKFVNHVTEFIYGNLQFNK